MSRVHATPVHVVQLTPAGRSAVATCLVSGPHAVRLAAPLVAVSGGRTLTTLPSHRIVTGRWLGTQPEEIVVCCRGADEVAIHCHGGRLAISTIISDLVAAGGQMTDWQTGPANWANGAIPASILAAEAVQALAEARTERGAAILLDQLQGALYRELQALIGLLQNADAPQAARRIAALLEYSHLGSRLVQPWRVSICGAPNVGKSSLINALLGYARAIVASQPGTTRDVVSAVTAIDGWPVELSDTAGLRSADDDLEAAGIALGKAHLAQADLCILVLDRAAPFGPHEQGLAATLPQAMIVHNKCDLTFHSDPRPAGMEVSARTGQGIELLLTTITAKLVPAVPEPGCPLPFHHRHVAALKSAAASISKRDLSAAQDQLQRLAGSVVT